MIKRQTSNENAGAQQAPAAIHQAEVGVRHICGLTPKKPHASELQQTDVVAGREAWRAGQSNLDLTRLCLRA
jgi:hypothetical protein